MKPFKYDEVDKRLNKKSLKQVEQQRMRENFLRLYEDIPIDSKMQKVCNNAMETFNQRRKNNRYYSYELKKQIQTSSKDLRTEEIKKLGKYAMPYKSAQKTAQQDTQAKIEKAKAAQIRKKALRIKFKLQKMKKLIISMNDIINKQLFSKQVYKFGSEIFLATKEGNAQKVWRIMIQNKYSIFSIDNTGKTILFWACIRGHPKIVKMCIDAGMEVDKKDLYGLSPLNYAIKYNHQDCVKLLMLALVESDESHQKDLRKADQRVRNVFNVAIGLKKLFKTMAIQQRNQLFEQQYQYLYK